MIDLEETEITMGIENQETMIVTMIAKEIEIEQVEEDIEKEERKEDTMKRGETGSQWLRSMKSVLESKISDSLLRYYLY